MPVLGDFTVIRKLGQDGRDGTFAKPYRVGPNSRFEVTFNTGGLHHSDGLLTMMVRGLTAGSARVAIVGVNGEQDIGRLSESSAADSQFWRQQQFITEGMAHLR